MRTTRADSRLIYYNAINEGARYFRVHDSLKSMIIGISGGIDSAVTAALARRVIEELKDERRIRLYGYSMPCLSNKEDEVVRSQAIGDALCDDFSMRSLDGTFNRLIHSVDGELTPKDHAIRLGNIKARLRMMILYDQANKYNGLVLSTDNYTEYLLGFWTLHGDVGDFGFIQKLWKSEVYDLAEWMVVNKKAPASIASCANAVPTDGLGVTDSDMDQLVPNVMEIAKGAVNHQSMYRIVDEVLQAYLEGSQDKNSLLETYHSVIERYEATHFKRENPFNISRERLL